MIPLFPVLLALAAAPAETQAASPASSAEAAPSPADPIVVTGTPVEKERRPVLGSRVPREREADPRGFVPQIASDTGFAGLTPGSGMDPFAGGENKVKVKSCKGSDRRMTAVALCVLALAQKRIVEGDLTAARSAIDRVLGNPNSSPADKFFAHRFSFQIASLENDDRDRSDALLGMLETGLLSAEDRVLARKTLASMALARGDQAAAIAQLERLVAEAPGEARAQANLAVLYAKSGLHDRARPHLQEAARLTAASGQSVPKSWIDYLAGRH